MKVAWREAWHDALYGADGFFLHHAAADHFRTSVNSNPLFAEAVLALLRREGLGAVVDMGAGAGELLTALRRLDSSLSLTGVDLAPRPADLDLTIEWSASLPGRVEGLLIAHEWLDNIPCDVVELDAGGVIRLVEIDPSTGEEALGQPYESSWLDEWWPLTTPGQRAEIGSSRDTAWADAVARVDGIALAIDYAHTRDNRPPYGSMRSYAAGREVDVLPDGTRDVTAHVAIDSVASAVGATLRSQRDALAELGIDGSRPPLELASTDPGAYALALSRATLAAELRATGGWGDFVWALSDTRDVER